MEGLSIASEPSSSQSQSPSSSSSSPPSSLEVHNDISGQASETRKAKDILEEIKSAKPVMDSNGEVLNEPVQSFLHFIVKYANKSLEVRLSTDDTVVELKAILYSLTDVPFERQKILGLVKGRLASDETTLSDLQIPPTSLRSSPHPNTGEKRVTISLLGTPLDQTFRDPGSDAVDNQLAGAAMRDIDYSDPASWPKHREPKKDPEALAKLRKAISRFSSTFPIMNEPRQGLKGGLLVLDLDYTMVDTKRLLNGRSPPKQSERPNLHEFLAAVYPYYDIVVWSQTSHFWLEAKLTELGCLTHELYKISFVLDRTPMFSVKTHLPGQAKNKHEVKALEIIWRRFPALYGPHNTIHIDDLSRNFAMNPNCGLKIKPYRHSPTPDHELIDLQEYLIRLAEHGLKSFEELGGHSKWKRLLQEHKSKQTQ